MVYYYLVQLLGTRRLFVILSMQSELIIKVTLQKTSWEAYKHFSAEVMKTLSK